MKDTTSMTPRTLASALMAVSSALLFTVFVFEDLSVLRKTSLADIPWGLVLRYVASMAIAGGLIGALLSGLFGRRGLVGWALALVAGLLIATVAGLLGSFFGGLPDLIARGTRPGDMIAVLAGGMVLPFVVADWPLIGALWLALLGATHILIRRLRQQVS